jgi:hypothetical protein
MVMQSLRWLGRLLILGLVVSPTAWGVDLTTGGLAKFVDREGPDKDLAVVKFKHEANIAAPLPDPRAQTSTLRFRSDSNDTGAAVLDPLSWRAAGSGFVYSDPAVAHGGVKKVVFKPGAKGGKLLVKAQRAAYGADPIAGPITFVEAEFTVGSTTYCGRFRSPPAEATKNEAGKVIYKGAAAPCTPPSSASPDIAFAFDSPEFSLPERVCLSAGNGDFFCNNIDDEDTLTHGVAIGDLNEDGFQDVVHANPFAQSSRACFGDGTGFFSCGDIGGGGVSSGDVALGDVNGDLHLDAVFVGSTCLGDGNGNFSCTSFIPPGGGTLGLTLGYVDGDAHLDAVFVGVVHDLACLGDGNGNFACQTIEAVATSNSAALADFDEDGNLDVVFANGGDNGNGQRDRVCLGDGTGAFTCADVSTDEFLGGDVVTGDFDEDGHVDAVFSNYEAAPQLCRGDGHGAFSCGPVAAEQDTSAAAVADMNGDSHLDVVFAKLNYQRNRLCLGDGAGGFTCSDVSSIAAVTLDVAVGFLD